MEEQHTADDQSHYEIALTAGQAFVAFVLLLLSLAASFAFGLMLGKGQADERLVVRKDRPVIEAGVESRTAPAEGGNEIVEMDVETSDFSDGDVPSAKRRATPAKPEKIAAVERAVVEKPRDAGAASEDEADARVKPVTERASEQVAAGTEPASPAKAAPATVAASSETRKAAAGTAAKASSERVPHVAQLLSTADQKTAEAMAVKLINRGFKTAYVERGAGGAVYRVRVRFTSESEARSAEPQLREFSREVWITAG